MGLSLPIAFLPVNTLFSRILGNTRQVRFRSMHNFIGILAIRFRIRTFRPKDFRDWEGKAREVIGVLMA